MSVLSPQSRKDWRPMSLYFTVAQMKQCELAAQVVMQYRSRANFLTSPCWMDEWALGYFCSLRDTGNIDMLQWAFLCNTFQPENINEQE